MLRYRIVAVGWLMMVVAASAAAQGASKERFREVDGQLEVEAEAFHGQSRDSVRRWYVTLPATGPAVEPDGDPPHAGSASGGAYLEILPDTRRTHEDKLIAGENFSNEPGAIAVLSYHVTFKDPGRYYVWVRAYSTGSEDNGIHVGVNGTWPESGRRMQWCEGKNSWRWDSKQRTAANHCGEEGKIWLDIAEPGNHTIQFSMREDGFEFDKWILSRNPGMKRPN